MISSFFSRDQLLEGLPARRASTLLFAIESRTAHLVMRARQVGARYLTEQTAAEQELAFLGALSHGRNAGSVVKIQELERYAPRWASLVPGEVGVRAAVAQLLAGKYTFRHEDVPAIRNALGLDDESVAQAFQRLYGKPPSRIYRTSLSRRERWQWATSQFHNRIEDLPPFWTAFALTLTETVGGGILALPIAVAQLGPLGGLVVILVLGLVNWLTIAGLSEALVHNGNMRYGNAYFGRLIRDYFGVTGMTVLTMILFVDALLSLLVYFVGFSTALESAIDSVTLLTN